jgi:DNA-binding response OmpR family regulator
VYGSTILVIDDEQENRDTLRSLLSKNFQILTASNGKEGLEIARRARPDAVIVDVQMPDVDGISVCKSIRNDPALKNMPVLMISAYGDENWRTESFIWGADDFIDKPYSGRELVARILSRLCWVREPKEMGARKVTSCGNMVVDDSKLEITVDAKPVAFTVFEFTLVKYFIENRGKVLSREKILAEVWKDEVVSERTVDTHIYTIRKKLTLWDHDLKTVHGAGYILRAR